MSLAAVETVFVISLLRRALRGGIGLLSAGARSDEEGAMHPRAEHLIRGPGLEPHPEGGYFRETFRSAREVAIPGAPARPALTHIYFLLARGQRSRWHRVPHEEVWHFHEGDPLELMWLERDLSRLERRILAAVGDGREPVAVVPAGCWQAARTSGEYSLVGCTMGPGFEFSDLAMLAAHDRESAIVRSRFPDVAALI